jgi:mycothiol synthase
MCFMTNSKKFSHLTEKYEIRPAKWTDVDHLVELRNASSQSTRGTDVTADHWQRRHWHVTGLNLDTDTLLVLAGKQAIAFVELTSESPFVVYEMVGVVHPDFRGQNLGAFLVNWAENRASQDLEKAPEGAAVFIQNSTFDSNRPGCDLLAAHGFEIVRDFVYLQIEMETPPPQPAIPAGIEIRELQSSDWDKIGPALSEAFIDHWGIVGFEFPEEEVDDKSDKPSPEETDPEAFNPEYFNSPGLCFVAWDGDEVAGSCLCNATTVEFPAGGYLGSLSIRPNYRRRGIGLALTLQVLDVYYERGTRHVLTDTDGDSFTRAYRLYQKAGMEIFRRELVYEKTIRAGKDLVKRNML